ncbi:MAG: hypothetical protein IJV18_04940 [Acidaminococcaceae bacterium]|nr:hypothetical protein [Acidaminococcaceae bacterium]MBQ7417425.1 hypothetical protein [Acidaminococcaceae bacterium]MBQ9256622.1 hypothetical protein [Acidaminococcaceae bacterium]MBQ9319757.1 hypothetical protein [Acidaminococcaceae bacterium]
MVTLVLVKNPFSPQDGREVRHIEYKGTIGTLLEQNVVSGVELQATVNGYGVSPDKEIQGFLVRQEKRMQFGRHGKHNMEIRNVEQIETLVFNPPFF